MPPFIIRRPVPSATAVAVAQAVAVGGYMLLGGPSTHVYRLNLLAGRDCTLPVPSSIAFIAQSNANTFSFEVGGLDHLGNVRKAVYTKTTTNRQTCSSVAGFKGGVVWSQIHYVLCLANSVPAETVRIGILYSGFARAAADLDTRLANDSEASGIYLPLPFVPDRSTDDFAVFPFQLSGYVGTLVDDGGVTAGGFAYGSRVPPVSLAAFGSLAPALDLGTKTFFCFPKATTDPTAGMEFSVHIAPGAMFNR